MSGLAVTVVAILLLLASTLFGLAQSIPAETRLQPGDTVRLTVLGLEDLTTEAMVGSDGALRLPLAGSVTAAGRTLDEVEDGVRTALAGTVFELHAGTGSTLVPIRPETVHLAIAAWRPVYVHGAVAVPGEQPFLPGASVRSALAQAGGAGVAGVLSPLEGVRQLAALRKLEVGHTLQSAIVRRLEAQLSGTGLEADPPSDPISRLQAERLALAKGSLAADRSFLEETLALTDARLNLLARQNTAQTEAVAADEAEAARAQDLRERGLVANDRVLEARRAELLSGTRLLDTEGEAAAVSVRRADIARDLATLDDQRRAEALAELETAAQRLREIDIEIDAARTQVALAGLTTAPSIEATIHRREGNAVTAIPAALDAPLRPGDIVEIRLIPPAADDTR